MVDCHYSPHLLGAMDRLWFQQIILSPPVEPIQHPPATKTNLKPLLESAPSSSDGIMCTNSSPNLESTLLDHEPLSTISDSSPNLISAKDSDDLEKEKDNEMKMENYKMKRPKRLSLLGSKTRSRLSSPSLQHTLPTHITRNRVIDVHGNVTSSPSMSKLRKTMSCKSLWELEYEEVKGFMDLGFRFDKEQICPRMMTVIPGLQRLDSLEFQELISSSTSTSSVQEENEEEEEEEEGEEEVVERPYLSEAWLIKKPNSPLLNLRMPHATASTDMKDHLKFWARTVACAVQLEV